MVEYMSVRDLHVLARIVGQGRVKASELSDIASSTGGVYTSINRLIAMGMVKKVDRGVYEATEHGRKTIINIILTLKAELYGNKHSNIDEPPSAAGAAQVELVEG